MELKKAVERLESEIKNLKKRLAENEREFISIKQAMEKYSLSRAFVYDLFSLENLTQYKLRKRTFIDENELRRIIGKSKRAA